MTEQQPSWSDIHPEEAPEPPKPGMAYLMVNKFIHSVGNKYHLEARLEQIRWGILMKMEPGVLGQTLLWKDRLENG